VSVDGGVPTLTKRPAVAPRAADPYDERMAMLKRQAAQLRAEDEASKRSILVDAQIGQHGGLKTTKTGEERAVDVSARLAGVLMQAINGRKAVMPAPKVVSISGAAPVQDEARPPGPWLFYPELGTTPGVTDAQRVYKNALRAMRRTLERAGLPAHFTLHSLRHTFGSGLISRGVSPAYVQQQMGHASIEQTVGTYGSWFPVRVPGAVDALAEATAPAATGHQMDTLGGLEAAQSPLSAYVSILVQVLVLVLLVHVLHGVLQEEDVGLARAVDLEGVLVVPLDDAADLLAVLEHDDHPRLVGHLLQVVEALRVRLLGRDGLAGARGRARGHLVLQLGQVGTDQLAVHLRRPPAGDRPPGPDGLPVVTCRMGSEEECGNANGRGVLSF
jgi:hypothetical protein